MKRPERRGMQAGASLIKAVRDRAQRLITDLVREEGEQLKLQVGSLQSRFVQQATYQSLQDAEFKVFSQNGEDGIIQYLLSKVSIGTPTFVEVGVEDYSESNTRFLLMNNYWRGFIVDGGTRHLAYLRNHNIGWKFDIRGASRFVTSENINGILSESGFIGDIGLFSLDIDGNDYWVLQATNVVSPRIVIVEYNSVFGPTAAVTVPYEPTFVRARAHHSNLYYGASLSALAHLMQGKGYALVGSNRAGNNAFFVRRDVLGNIREVSSAECYVVSPFAESRGADGSLTYIRELTQRLSQIGHLPVHDVHQEALVTVSEILLDAQAAANQ
jgi:hypothetical protein